MNGRTWMLAAVGAGVAVGLVGVPLYVVPARDQPREVDAVYVIGPPTDRRMELAERMLADGLADTLVVSLTEDPDQRAAMKRASEVCDDPAGAGVPPEVHVHCAMPEPFTTRGEARWLRELADTEQWDSAAILTFTPHLTRTRVIFERCWDGDTAYVDSGERLDLWSWAYQYAYQSAAFVKVAAEGRRC